MLTTTRLLVALAVIAGVLALVCTPSLTWARLPANELWREAMLAEAVGYGRNATGGAGGDACYVTNLNNSGTGSLRACAQATGTLWVIFQVSGTINLSSEMYVSSNHTIDGRGADITIRNTNTSFAGGLIHVGKWFTIIPDVAATNVILTHLKIGHVNGDAGLIIGPKASNVWVNHITFQYALDDMFYIGSHSIGDSAPAPTDITVSWNHWIPHGSDPVPPSTGPILCGPNSDAWCDKCHLTSGPDLTQDAGFRVTYHHNHLDHMYERCWLLWWGHFHSFNNFYDTGQNNTMTQTARGAQLRSDNDIFANNGNSYPFFNYSEFASAFPPAGKIRVEGLFNPDGANYEENDRLNVFNPAADYSYTPDTANETLRLKIINNAGWQNVTPPVAQLSPPENLRQLFP